MAQTIKKIFICSKCDAQFSKWNGRCLECGAWGTLSESTLDAKEEAKAVNVEAAEIVDLGKKSKGPEKRILTNISEIDRVLGGGIVPGSLVLLSGEPGIGKSTLLMQLGDSIKDEYMYVSGEESAAQVKDRLLRLKASTEKIKFLSATNTEKIIAALEKNKPKIAIIDSIQTVYSLLSPSEPGSINQIRTSTVRFLETAKKHSIAIVLVGHITKDGQVAGPKSLEHIVDTVIHLEADAAHGYRILRASKNRFGSVNELGILEMTSEGMREIKNPSSVFINKDYEEISGSVISVIMEGSRPFLVEVQALVTKTVFGYPQRKASGFDLNRLQVLTAVLTKRAKVNLANQDVILNIVGGLKVNDPGLDLAVCLAITSSLLNQKINRDTVAIVEVGLGGEVRNVKNMEARLKEIKKIGFKNAYIPNVSIKTSGLKILQIKNLPELLKNL